jgi:hypothetical protein
MNCHEKYVSPLNMVRRNMRHAFQTILFVALVVFITGLVLREAEKEPDYAVRITPTPFFSGELKRLESHLEIGWTACFKIKSGGRATCRPEIEVWSRGHRTDRAKYGARFGQNSDELSFSVRNIEAGNDEREKFRVHVGGIHSYGRELDGQRPDPNTVARFGPILIRKPVDLRRVRDSVVVWVMGKLSAEDSAALHKVAPKGLDGDFETLQGIEKELKKMQWVMMIRLVAEK